MTDAREPAIRLSAIDISEDELAEAARGCDRPELLYKLVDIARRTFGYFDTYYPYRVMYPWVAGRLEALPAGSRVLDLGAGISPLPLFLAERGSYVDCVDNSPIIRTLPAGPDWTGWGFFDYGQVHRNLKAHHCAADQYQEDSEFEAIYSVGMLAHLSRDTRECTLEKCRNWLRPDGTMAITIDIIPSSDFVWNRFADVEVESPIRHGTAQGVLAHLQTLGFDIVESTIVRAIPDSRTDVLLIHARAGRGRSGPIAGAR